MHFLGKSLLIFCICLCCGMLATAQAQLVQQTDQGQVDWELGVIRSTGIGVPPPRAVNAGQARALALRAAQADAYRNLLEVTKGVRVSSTTVVNNFITTSDEIRLQVEGIVKGARIADQKYQSDGSVEVTIEMPMFGPKGLSAAIYKAQEKDFQKKSDFVVPKELQQQSPPGVSEDQKRKEAQAAAAKKASEDADRKAAEARKKADAEALAKKKADEDTKRIQEEMLKKQREQEEQARQEIIRKKAMEDEMARIDAEKARLAQEKEEADRKLREAEEASRKAKDAEERKKAEAAEKAAQDEAAKKAQEQKAAEAEALKAREAEEKRHQIEALKKAQEEKERKAREEELKRLEEQQRKAEEARKKAEDDAAKQARDAEEKSKAEEAARKAAEDAAKKASEQTMQTDAQIGDVSAFSGAIIDTSGTGAKPAMSPKILVLPPPPPEQEVYSMAQANYQIALNAGLVGYARSVDIARDKQKNRIGDNPMIIKAVKVKDDKSSDIIIEYKDGIRLAQLDKEKKVMENCKIVMVLGKSGQAMLLPMTIELAWLQPEN